MSACRQLEAFRCILYILYVICIDFERLINNYTSCDANSSRPSIRVCVTSTMSHDEYGPICPVSTRHRHYILRYHSVWFWSENDMRTLSVNNDFVCSYVNRSKATFVIPRRLLNYQPGYNEFGVLFSFFFSPLERASSTIVTPVTNVRSLYATVAAHIRTTKARPLRKCSPIKPSGFSCSLDCDVYICRHCKMPL